MDKVLKIGFWVLGIACAIPILLIAGLWGYGQYSTYAYKNFELGFEHIVRADYRPEENAKCDDSFHKLAATIIYVSNEHPRVETKFDDEQVTAFMFENLLIGIPADCFGKLSTYFNSDIIEVENRVIRFRLDVGRVIMGFKIRNNGKMVGPWSYVNTGWP